VRELARAAADSAPLAFVPLPELEGVPEAPERLIVLGGDGTVSAAVDWLERRSFRSPIAIVPAGTGNNLARGLGIPLEPGAALELALAGRRLRAVDAIRYSTPGGGGSGGRPRLFIQTAALGFPADIAGRYDRWRRQRLFRLVARPLGPYVYRWLALSGLLAAKRRERRGERLLRLRAALPGETIDETVLAVFLGNEKSLGGNFHPCPRAEVDDGKLDLCLVRAGTGASYLDTFRRVVRGEHLELARTVLYRQSAGPLELELSEPAALLADGDLWVESARFRFEVLPRRVEVVVG
jgi:diacylglycerol kinase (ATP)